MSVCPWEDQSCDQAGRQVRRRAMRGWSPLELEPRGQAGAASGLAQAQTCSPGVLPAKHLPQPLSHLQGCSSLVALPVPELGCGWRMAGGGCLRGASGRPGGSRDNGPSQLLLPKEEPPAPARGVGGPCARLGAAAARVPCHRHLLPAAAFVHSRRLSCWAPSPPTSPASCSLAVLCPGQRLLPGLHLGVPPRSGPRVQSYLGRALWSIWGTPSVQTH